MSSQSSEQEAPKRIRLIYRPNVGGFSLWIQDAGASPAAVEYTRSDICAALVEALERLADAYFTFGEALVKLPNQPLLPKAVEAEYSALIDAAFAARTAIAQAREEGVK